MSSRTQISPPVEGVVYRVKADDCCVTLQFTSCLKGVTYDPSDPEREYPAYLFENGVEITGPSVTLTKQD